MGQVRNVRKLSILLLASAAGAADAGTLYFNGGTWGSFGGTAAGTTSAWTANNDSGGLSPSLTLTSPASGDNWTLTGSFTYSVLWIPASQNDTPPNNVDIQFAKEFTPTVPGNGMVDFASGGNDLYEMDSTNNYLSGATANLATFDVISALQLQANGSYQASGTVNSDTVTTDFNSQSQVITTGEEAYTVTNMTGTN